MAVWEAGQRLKFDQTRWISNLLVYTGKTYIAVASQDKVVITKEPIVKCDDSLKYHKLVCDFRYLVLDGEKIVTKRINQFSGTVKIREGRLWWDCVSRSKRLILGPVRMRNKKLKNVLMSLRNMYGVASILHVELECFEDVDVAMHVVEHMVGVTMVRQVQDCQQVSVINMNDFG